MAKTSNAIITTTFNFCLTRQDKNPLKILTNIYLNRHIGTSEILTQLVT